MWLTTGNGVAFDEDLKPIPQRKVGGKAFERPAKRHQGPSQVPSPGTSQSPMAPPPVENRPSRQTLKTPWPDVTVGLRHSIVADALVKRGMGVIQASDFIKELQEERKLLSSGMAALFNMRFPILIVEGKAYTTGANAFEAQNQAAVGGSCMVDLQQRFTDLLRSLWSGFQDSEIPFAFSIVAWGPRLDFWVHYATSSSGVWTHYMYTYQACHAYFIDGVPDERGAFDDLDGGRILKTDYRPILRAGATYSTKVTVGRMSAEYWEDDWRRWILKVDSRAMACNSYKLSWRVSCEREWQNTICFFLSRFLQTCTLAKWPRPFLNTLQPCF